MKAVFLSFIFLSFSFASTLLTYNIYDRSDRLDIMLSFDSPYEGKIYQKKLQNTTTLTLEDLTYYKKIQKDINSPIVQNLRIIPQKDSLKIVLESQNPIAVIASKTTDGFGLRIRAKNIVLKQTKSQTDNITAINTQKESQKDLELIDQRYIFVMIFLFILLLFMLWIKRRVSRGNLPQNSWLFKNSNLKENIDIKILYKKPIDAKNSVILIEYADRKYLLMSGTSNVLIDTFSDREIENDREFEKVFENNRKKLDDYLKLQDRRVKNYKDKASENFLSELETQ